MPQRKSQFDRAMEDQIKLDNCNTQDEVGAFFADMDEAARRREKGATTKSMLKRARANHAYTMLHIDTLNKIMKRAADKARWKRNRRMRDELSASAAASSV